MKRSKPQEAPPLNRPFGNLGTLLAGRELKKGAAAPAGHHRAHPDPRDENAVFQEAMKGVVPLQQGRQIAPRPSAAPSFADSGRNDDTISRLQCLVREGKGFVVSQTPEYMEGKSPAAAPDITARLHGGCFSIEAFIDLHGQTAAEAEQTFDRFLNESTRCGRRAVLVIHGRGLSSPHRPVLKNRVGQWLGSGKWRKWVAAYCSARLCDGGAGATYVLLRSRPLTKKQQRT